MVREILTELEQTIHQEHATEASVTETSNDVSEIYSFRSIVERAARQGLRFEWSLHLTGDTPEGEAWDFSKPFLMRRAVGDLNANQPDMLVLQPICGPFGKFQGLNYCKMIIEQVGAALSERVAHLKFAILMCRLQANRQRSFTLEHPVAARSWMTDTTQDVLKLFGVMIVDFDSC